jgi:hypothetical protein
MSMPLKVQLLPSWKPQYLGVAWEREMEWWFRVEGLVANPALLH